VVIDEGDCGSNRSGVLREVDLVTVFVRSKRDAQLRLARIIFRSRFDLPLEAEDSLRVRTRSLFPASGLLEDALRCIVATCLESYVRAGNSVLESANSHAMSVTFRHGCLSIQVILLGISES